MCDFCENEDVIAELRRLRRMFHKHPETGFDCVWTSARIEDELTDAGIDAIEHVGDHSLLVTLENGEGPSIGLRADFDALPVTEENDVPYQSDQTGKMHACGHDGHTAMLLVTLTYLHRHRDAWRGRITGIFQEAEEGPLPGGASKIKDHPAIVSLDAIFALHVSPDVPIGKVAAIEGPAMASVDIFEATVNGKGGHAAYPDEAINPLDAAAVFATRLKALHQRLNEREPLTVCVTKIIGGTTFNVIPETTKIVGTVRTFSEEMRTHAQKTIAGIADDVAGENGVGIELEYLRGYPSVRNHPEAFSMMRQSVIHAIGRDAFIPCDEPRRVSEDFAYYAQKVPGCIAWLGIAKQGQKMYPLHHPRFDFDEEALTHGVAVFVELITHKNRKDENT